MLREQHLRFGNGPPREYLWSTSERRRQEQPGPPVWEPLPPRLLRLIERGRLPECLLSTWEHSRVLVQPAWLPPSARWAPLEQVAPLE